MTAVHAGLDDLLAAPLWQLDDAEQHRLVAEAERAERRIAAAKLALLQRIDSRGSTADSGATSTGAWLRTVAQSRPGRARADVALAVALDRYPLLRAALADGTASAAQVEVCVAALDALPATVDAETVSRGEAFLLEQCAVLDPNQLAKIGKHLLHVLDPDGPEILEADEQNAVRRRELRVSEREGGVKLSGWLDAEAGATLLTALDPLCLPRTGADQPVGPDGKPRDPRTPAQRRADALVELAGRALDAGDLPTQGAERPHVTVTMDLATLMRAAEAFDPHACTGADLDRGGPLSAATARRIACDAKVIPVVLGGASQPLDVGREQRTVPRHLRRAVIARDRGCAFPGCDRPPAWCEAHHVQHWADGGDTALSNLVLLCRHHHHVIHHTPWTVRIDECGAVGFTDPSGKRVRATADLRRDIEHLARPPDPGRGA
jgi:hypothetical protein